MNEILSTMASTSSADTSDSDYRARTDATLAAIERSVDRWLQEDVIDIDVSRTGGLLELAFQSGAKIVVNTQPPLHELWMAARTGGYHYKWQDGAWRDTRDGREFFDALSAAASELAGITLRFAPEE